jgi:hypothetical protein
MIFTCIALAGVGGFVQLSMLMSLILELSISESSILSSSELTDVFAGVGRQSIGSRQELPKTAFNDI